MKVTDGTEQSEEMQPEDAAYWDDYELEFDEDERLFEFRFSVFN